MKYFYSVITTKPLPPLTFSSDRKLKIGQIAKVDVNGSKTFGIISDQIETFGAKTKKIDEALLNFYPEEFLNFVKNMAKKYKIPEGKFLSFAKSIFENLEKYKKNFSSLSFSTKKIARPQTSILSSFFDLDPEAWSGKLNLFVFPSERQLILFSEKLKEGNISFEKFVKNSDIKKISKLDQGNFLILRKGIFLPYSRIDNIFISNYHQKFKFLEDRKPKFSYLDLARDLGKHSGSNIYLISKTPFTRDEKPYPKIGSFEKILKSEIIYFSGQNGSFWISPKVFASIEIAFEKNENILIIWEKKGLASWVECRNCGEVLSCKKCGEILSIRNSVSICENCGEKKRAPNKCAKCFSNDFLYKSKGIDLLKNEIASELGILSEQILTFDAEKKAGETKELIKKLKSGGKILLSTTAIEDSVKLMGQKFHTFVILRAEMFFHLEDELSKERYEQKIFDLDKFGNEVAKNSFIQKRPKKLEN